VHLDWWCATLDFGVRVRPTAVSTQWLSPGLSLTGWIGSTRTYHVTPVVFGWTWLSDIATGIKLHGGGFVSGWKSVWTCW